MIETIVANNINIIIRFFNGEKEPTFQTIFGFKMHFASGVHHTDKHIWVYAVGREMFANVSGLIYLADENKYGEIETNVRNRL